MKSFEQPLETEKNKFVVEILSRKSTLGSPALSDEELVMIAEKSFLEYDKREAKNELNF